MALGADIMQALCLNVCKNLIATWWALSILRVLTWPIVGEFIIQQHYQEEVGYELSLAFFQQILCALYSGEKRSNFGWDTYFYAEKVQLRGQDKAEFKICLLYFLLHRHHIFGCSPAHWLCSAVMDPVRVFLDSLCLSALFPLLSVHPLFLLMVSN